jgi:hypothetical protein
MEAYARRTWSEIKRTKSKDSGAFPLPDLSDGGQGAENRWMDETVPGGPPLSLSLASGPPEPLMRKVLKNRERERDDRERNQAEATVGARWRAADDSLFSNLLQVGTRA